MSNTKKMTLDDRGQIQWQDIDDNAVVRFELDNGQIIECKIEGDRLDVRTPEGCLSVKPRFSNSVAVSVEKM